MTDDEDLQDRSESGEDEPWLVDEALREADLLTGAEHLRISDSVASVVKSIERMPPVIPPIGALDFLSGPTAAEEAAESLAAMASRPVVPAFEFPDLEPVNYATDDSVLEQNELLRHLLQEQIEQRNLAEERAADEARRRRINTILVVASLVCAAISAVSAVIAL